MVDRGRWPHRDPHFASVLCTVLLVEEALRIDSARRRCDAGENGQEQKCRKDGLHGNLHVTRCRPHDRALIAQSGFHSGSEHFSLCRDRLRARVWAHSVTRCCTKIVDWAGGPQACCAGMNVAQKYARRADHLKRTPSKKNALAIWGDGTARL